MAGNPSGVQRAWSRFSLFLAPSMIQVAISFMMLPIATRVVGPREYGVFALAGAYTGFGSALATLGGSFIIAHRFLGATHDEQKDVVSTVTLLGIGAVVLYSFILFGVWRLLPGSAEVSFGLLSLAMVSVVIGQPWIVAMDVLTIRGDARSFAAMSVVQSIVSALTLGIGLFYFRLGGTSFFISQFTGAVVALVGAVMVLRNYFRLRLDRTVVLELRALGLLSGLSNVSESVQVAVERSALSLHAGIAQLGIYSNSQAYRGFAAVPVKAIARSVWPVTLADARNPDSDFRQTRIAWDVAYIVLTCCGVFFATSGDWLIGTLTHGKFTAAYKVAMVWMIYLLIQNTGKPQVGVLYALGGGRIYSRLVIISGGVGIVALLALTPLIGIWGAVAGAIAQQVFLRISIQRAAAAIRRTPFQDEWAYFGGGYILAVFAVRQYAGGGVLTNVAILGGAYLLLLVIARRPLQAAMQRMQVTGNLSGVSA